MAALKATTDVPAARSVGEVMDLLTQMGAEAVQVRYARRQPTAVMATFQTQYGERHFMLPVHADLALKALQADRQAMANPGHRKIPDLEQALNSAWRVMQTWCEAQLGLIRLGMATPAEVLLPYMLLDGPQGLRTVYMDYADHQPALAAGR